MANYAAICKCVRDGHIIGLRLRDSNGEPHTYRRDEIIDMIETSKDTIVTEYPEPGKPGETFGRPMRGEEVRVYNLKWLRTVADDIEEDNLGELQECKGDDCGKLPLEHEILKDQ